MKRYSKNIILLILFPVLLVCISLVIGSSQNIGFGELFHHIALELGMSKDTTVLQGSLPTILWQVRLPRIVLTFLVGASLASSGGVLQAVFRNPIVDPFTLGISSGSAFGAALAMLFPVLAVNASAFIFGVAAVAITYLVSYAGAKTSIVSMVLAGMIVSGVFTALLTVLQYLSDPYKLQAIVQWTMGNLHTASWQKVQTAIFPVIIGLLVIVILRWKLNLLALGDHEAMAVGVNPTLLKLILMAVTTMITASSVAAVGVISLFGLIVPHISRMIFGPDNSITVWANISIGGTFLLLIDDFSRTVMPFEIPIGVFTMIIGAPIFMYLMRKKAINWNS
ncbi:iron ABC transporter permease [Chryseobacterium indologenes]|uniref:FecCD family ABC transporter permease n=1 Tax=Chryseobacterium indologenes TaxID=253 RepID=UPI0003E08660|nr:iron ABC transporter permease [Chryseobacterium indologenes]QPQ53926.1 iron ABC transporter permease [Chryseobacterium indologenes]GAE63380.1 putative iron ABC transporter permease protein [Chryseobacterium indologenes NBRC 14944]SFJ11175.1 iron complex transport system permease protein [Chryseobacterium indologenes]SUX49263.1 Probable ABC transporter permease protein HI_1471 [Chryseobacterium indologenes]